MQQLTSPPPLFCVPPVLSYCCTVRIVPQITQAMDGQEALKLLAEEEMLPDVILLDVMMPGMSGYEVRCAVLCCIVICQGVPCHAVL